MNGVLRIERGEPSPEELAALVTAVALVRARTVAAAPAEPPPPSAWLDRSRSVRRPLAAGPGAWRASGWPR